MKEKALLDDALRPELSSRAFFWAAYVQPLEKTMDEQQILNPQAILDIKRETNNLCAAPDHQEGIRCKAPRSDD